MHEHENVSGCASRRSFLGSAAGLTALGATYGSPSNADAVEGASAKPQNDGELDLPELRDAIRTELFDRVLPFWDKFGVDHEHGGFMCALYFDGSLANTNKYHWYQGRGLWVYSYLFNHFGKKAAHLEIARKTKEFLLRHAIGADGWWAEEFTRDGTVIKPFSGDVYGMFVAAEGLQEYAWAAGDDQARDLARSVLVKLFHHVNRPEYNDLYAPRKGYRVMGVWMYMLQACTQYLNRWDDRELERFATVCVDAIMNKHFNPEIGLTNEYVAFDFSRPKEVANKCLLGHCIQAFWMVIDEARRRKDSELLETCIARTRRHLDIGWDHVFGGLIDWVNVDQLTYNWGPQKYGDAAVGRPMVGEYNYLKSFWSLNEVMLTTLYIYQLRRPTWAARYFQLARQVVDDKFSRRRHGQDTYLLVSDRRMKTAPRIARQDNYHPLRRMMRNLLAVEQMLGDQGRRISVPNDCAR